MPTWFSETWVCCRERDIWKRSSMNAFTGGDRSDWEMEMSVLSEINSKIIFIPAKNNRDHAACKNSPQMLMPARWSNNGWRGVVLKAIIIRC